MAPRAADPTKVDDSIDVASETTPLLHAPENTATSTAQNGTLDPSQANGHTSPKPTDTTEQDGVQQEGKKMPHLQVLVLCYASLGEPIAFFAIFPFVNEMIAINGNLNEKDVGFYSGLIESLFSLTQMLLMIIYGRAADRLGRKPVLVFSLTGVGFATALFGMSKTIWQMIVTRCLAGVFAGSVVTIRTMLSENTDKRTQARAFSWYMFTRNLGIFLGPIVGASAILNLLRVPQHLTWTDCVRRRACKPNATIPFDLRRRQVLEKLSLWPPFLYCRGHRPLFCNCMLRIPE